MVSDLMTLEEAARYIHVAGQTIAQWVQQGEMPGEKHEEGWQFNRKEIDVWVEARRRRGVKSALSFSGIERIVDRSRIHLIDVTKKSEALQLLIDSIMTVPGLKNRDEFEAAVLHREELMSTGIGLGVAVPHVRLGALTSLHVAIGISKHAIYDWESLDSQPVRIVVMVAAGKGQHQEYIRLLAYLSSILKNEFMRQQLLDADDTKVISTIFLGQTA